MTQEQSTTALGLKKWTKMDPKSLFLLVKLRILKCELILSPHNWISNRKCVFCILRGSFRGANDPRAVATALGLKKWTKIGPKRLFFNSKSWNSKCKAILSLYNWILNRKCGFWFVSGSSRGAISPRAVHDCFWAEKMNENGPQKFIFHFKKLKFKMWAHFIT